MQKLTKEDLTYVGSGSTLREGRLGLIVDEHMAIIYDTIMDRPESTLMELSAATGASVNRVTDLVALHYIKVRRVLKPARIRENQMSEGLVLPHMFTRGRMADLCKRGALSKKFYIPRLLLEPQTIIALEHSKDVLADRKFARSIKKGEL